MNPYELPNLMDLPMTENNSQSTEQRQLTMRELHDRNMEMNDEINRLNAIIHHITNKRFGNGPSAVCVRLASIEEHIRQDDIKIRAYRAAADDSKARAENANKVAAFYTEEAKRHLDKCGELETAFERVRENIGPIGDDMRSLAERLAAIQASTLQLGTDNQEAHGRVLRGIADCIEICDKVRRGTISLGLGIEGLDSSDGSVPAKSNGEQQPLPSGCDVELGDAKIHVAGGDRRDA